MGKCIIASVGMDPCHYYSVSSCTIIPFAGLSWRLMFIDRITQLSRSCFMHILDLRRIRPMLDLKTASTIATSIVHAKLDYCNSLFLNIDLTQINRPQAIQNALARAVTKTPKHHHITPVLKKLHWLKIPERIEYIKVISLTYSTLQSSQPSYLRQLFTIQPPRSTRSSSTLTLLRPLSVGG